MLAPVQHIFQSTLELRTATDARSRRCDVGSDILRTPTKFCSQVPVQVIRMARSRTCVTQSAVRIQYISVTDQVQLPKNRIASSGKRAARTRGQGRIG